jgi:hypothetical protein
MGSRYTLFFLGPTSNSKGFWIKNSGRNLVLNLVWILKGFKPFGENPRNSPKLYLGMSYTNIIFYDITCIQEFKVSLQVAFGTKLGKFGIFEIEFEFVLGVALLPL